MSAEVIVAPAVASSPSALEDTEAVAAASAEEVAAATDATAATKDTDDSSTAADVAADKSAATEPIAPLTATTTTTTVAATGDPPTIVEAVAAVAPTPTASAVADSDRPDQADSAPIASEQLPEVATVPDAMEPPAPNSDTTTLEPITSTLSFAGATSATPVEPAAERANAVLPATAGAVGTAVDGSRATLTAPTSVTSDSEDLLESESGVVTTASVSVQLCCGHACIGIVYFPRSSYADMTICSEWSRERKSMLIYTQSHVYLRKHVRVRLHWCGCEMMASFLLDTSTNVSMKIAIY